MSNFLLEEMIFNELLETLKRISTEFWKFLYPDSSKILLYENVRKKKTIFWHFFPNFQEIVCCSNLGAKVGLGELERVLQCGCGSQSHISRRLVLPHSVHDGSQNLIGLLLQNLENSIWYCNPSFLDCYSFFAIIFYIFDYEMKS